MSTTSGIPLAVTLTAANLHDLRQLLGLVFMEFPKIGGIPGRWDRRDDLHEAVLSMGCSLIAWRYLIN